jgi:serine/threonine-protein kinase
MQYLDGESLAEFLARNRPLSPDAALPWLRQIAAALGALHRGGLVHCDLKPSNIMLVRGRNGETSAIVTDFGLTTAIDNDSSLFASDRDQNAGAPYFMAPELLRDGKASRQSDIYALGVVADEMVTRTRAFPTRSLPELIYNKIWGAAVPPKDRADELPAHWNQAILKAIDKSPEKRFQTVDEFTKAFETHPDNPEEKHWTRRAVFAATIGGAVWVGNEIAKRLETSVEVFDFENQSADAGQDYFCRGTGLELMRRLMHVDGLRVVPRHATRAKSPAPPKSRFSLDGALQAHEGRVRLSVFLTDNEDGALVWSQAFDRRQISNALSLQLDLANGAADALEQRLTGGEGKDTLATIVRGSRRWLGLRFQSHLPPSPTADGVAFDHYMRGSKLLEEYSPSSVAAAIEHFQKAVERDPKFALAWAASADAYLARTDNEAPVGTELITEAKVRAQNAVRVAPDLPEAHLSLAATHQADWNWQEADRSFQYVLTRKPAHARTNRWYAGFLVLFGRFDEALGYAKKALELDPHDRATPVSVGGYLTMAHRYREAINILSEPAIRDSLAATWSRGAALALLGRDENGAGAAALFDAALTEAKRCAEMESRLGENNIANTLFAAIHGLRGDKASGEPYVQKLERDYRLHRLSPVRLAVAYTAMGRVDEALLALEHALAAHDSGLASVKVLPFFSSLHKQSRFQAVVRAVGV